MAYQYEYEDDEQKKKDSEGGQALGDGQPGVVGTTASSNSTNPQQQENSSGRWTNLKSYLDANNEQAKELGQKFAGGIENQANEFQGQLDSARNSFKSQVDQNVVPDSQNLVQDALSNPTGFANDQTKVSQFKKVREGQYSGPESFQDQNLNQKSNELNDFAQGAGSEEGRFDLLSKQFSKPQYSRGQQSLDQLLLQRGEGNRDLIENARLKAEATAPQYNSLLEELPQYAQNAKQQVQNSKQNLYDQVLGSINQTKQGVADRTNQIKQRTTDDYNSLLQSLAERQLTDEQFNRLGLKEGDAVYNADFSRYLSKPVDPNINTVATKDEQSRLQALSDLMDQANDGLPYADLAGSYQESPASFSKDRFDSELVNPYKDRLQSELAATPYKFATGQTQDLASAIPMVEQQLAHATPRGDQQQITYYQNLLNDLYAKRSEIENRLGANDKLKKRV